MAKEMKKESLALTAILLVTVVVLYLASFTSFVKSNKGDYWDRLAYTALALKTGNISDSQLHSATYTTTRSEVNTKTFDSLIGFDSKRNVVTDHYRYSCYNSSEIFSEQLGFYSSRVLYISLLRSFHTIGLSFQISFSAISFLSSVGVLLLVTSLATITIQTKLRLLVPIVVALAILHARIPFCSTPDCLVSAFFTGALICFMKDRSFLSSMLFIASVATRPDSIIPILVALAFMIVSKGNYRSRAIFIVTAIVSILLALAINSVSGSYPILITMHHATQSMLLHPKSFEPNWNRDQHFALIVGNLGGFMKAVGLACLLSYLIVYIARRSSELRRAMMFISIGFISSLARHLIFPRAEARYYFPSIACLLIGVVVVLSNESDQYQVD